MGKIVYLPLDERPCNAKFPLQIAAASDLVLVVPPVSHLGSKKRPALTEALAGWLLEQTADADRLIVSLDMLVYGGIVPSRLHHLSEQECHRRLQTIAACKRRNPRLSVYAFSLIMRAPSYDSSEEEPDYYAQYGYRIARHGSLRDKEAREGLTEDERLELQSILSGLPEPVLQDFLQRRKINAAVNTAAIEMAAEGTIDLLIIPLDDNAKYGYSSVEQRRLLLQAERLDLLDRVHLYPGADEVGCTLFARVFCEIKQYRPELFIRYSSTLGPLVIPKYEDRSLGESVKSHVTAAGGFIADNSIGADVVLMVNSPPVGQHEMAETSQPFGERDAAYFSETNLREFAQAIRRYADKGAAVAIADAATCNGSDVPLMKLLAKTGLLPRLSAYAGWNTSGNTLGTVIAHAIVESYYRRSNTPLDEAREAVRSRHSRQFYLSRLVEDWGYQAIVRGDIARNHLEALGIGYFDVSGAAAQTHELVRAGLKDFIGEYLRDLEPERIRLERVELPWKRLFEVGFELTLL